MKNLLHLVVCVILFAVSPGAPAIANDESPLTLTQAGGSRLKDLTSVEGARDNQLTSYGLVVGLAGSGDGKITETIQTTANMLQRFGVNVPSDTIKSGNVAAVMVTANIGPFSKPGSRIDVTVSSIGDAKTLQGGVLLQVPMLGANNVVYAVAQGAIAVGGFLGGAGGAGGATVQKNHPTVATIPGGAIVEREIPSDVVHDDSINLLLREPDFISAARMAEVVNQMFPSSAIARDAGMINVRIPSEYRSYYVNFLATIGSLEVAPDNVARIVEDHRRLGVDEDVRVREGRRRENRRNRNNGQQKAENTGKKRPKTRPGTCLVALHQNLSPPVFRRGSRHRVTFEPVDQMIDERSHLACQMPPVRINRLQGLAARNEALEHRRKLARFDRRISEVAGH